MYISLWSEYIIFPIFFLCASNSFTIKINLLFSVFFQNLILLSAEHVAKLFSSFIVT